jgi:hypothetical protein
MTYRRVENNFEALFILQKLVELLEPIYAWSSNEIEQDELRTGQRIIREPWQDYSDTKFLGTPLLKQLGLENYDWESEPGLYRIQRLESGVWLANPNGLGNEAPTRDAKSVENYLEVHDSDSNTSEILVYEDTTVLKKATIETHNAVLARLLGIGRTPKTNSLGEE